MHFQILIARDHPALPGHFPGQPLVPAVVMLDEMAKGLGRLTGQSITSVRQLRLLEPLSPGLALDITVQDKGGDGWALVGRTGDRVVVKGRFSSVPPDPDEIGPRSPVSGSPQNTDAVYRDLPHDGAMRLIERFHLSEKVAVCDLSVATDNPLVDTEGRLPAWMSLEYAAQLMACRSVAGGGLSFGRAMVVMVRSLACYGPGYLVAPADLSVQVEEEVAQPGAVQCRFQAWSADRLLAAGVFTVMAGA